MEIVKFNLSNGYTAGVDKDLDTWLWRQDGELLAIFSREDLSKIVNENRNTEVRQIKETLRRIMGV